MAPAWVAGTALVGALAAATSALVDAAAVYSQDAAAQLVALAAAAGGEQAPRMMGMRLWIAFFARAEHHQRSDRVCAKHMTTSAIRWWLPVWIPGMYRPKSSILE